MKKMLLLLLVIAGLSGKLPAQITEASAKSSDEIIILDMEDFNGMDEVIKSFEGKVVLVDVWATWCRPCIQEFTYYDKIRDFLAENPEINVLFISLDGNREERWRKFISDKELAGYHLLSDQSLHEELYERLKVTTIPRYLIYTKDGKLAYANAARPSQSRTLIKQLEKSLEH